jgi:hypothetical protein
VVSYGGFDGFESSTPAIAVDADADMALALQMSLEEEETRQRETFNTSAASDYEEFPSLDVRGKGKGKQGGP